MSSEGNITDGALDHLLSKFRSVESLWTDIRHSQLDDLQQRGQSSLRTPLLSDTPSSFASSSIDVDDESMVRGSGRTNWYVVDRNETSSEDRVAIDLGNSSNEADGATSSSPRRTLFEHEDGSMEGIERDMDGIHAEEEEECFESTSWYSNPMQVSAMISNFSTSYNVVNISLVLPILEQLWAASTTEEDKSAVASSLLAGMMVGQLFCGYLGDTEWLGRVGALIFVMVLQIVASLASAVLCHGYSSLIAWRFVLGVGAGGVYPLSAVLSAEQDAKSPPRPSSNEGHASRPSVGSSKSLHMVVLTFSMQGVGFLTVPIVMVTLLSITSNLELIWRVHLALGCIPGLVLMVIQCCTHLRAWHPRRVRVPTSEDEHVAEEEGRVERSAPDCTPASPSQSTSDPVEQAETSAIASLPSSACLGICDPVDAPQLPSRSLPHHSMWELIRQEETLVRKLLGTAGTWFLFDVLFYGNTLFQPIVIEAAFGPRTDTDGPIQMLKQTAVDTLILTLIALPGYALAGMVLGSKTLGCSQTPRYVMLQGFLAMSLLYLVIGVGWVELRRFPAVLLALYSLTFLFANYGPNTTTFCLPSLVYSPKCRTTLNGVSAAAGKLGAWTGASLFAPAADALGDATVMILCSLISVIAFFMTILFVPRVDDTSRRIRVSDRG